MQHAYMYLRTHAYSIQEDEVPRCLNAAVMIIISNRALREKREKTFAQAAGNMGSRLQGVSRRATGAWRCSSVDLPEIPGNPPQSPELGARAGTFPYSGPPSGVVMGSWAPSDSNNVTGWPGLVVPHLSLFLPLSILTST